MKREKGYVYNFETDNKKIPTTININNYNMAYNNKIMNSSLGNNGLIIMSPGYYTVVEDLYFYPGQNNRASIIIESDDVVLDFNHHSLTNSGNAIYGVVVARDCTNIRICNTDKNICEPQIRQCNKNTTKTIGKSVRGNINDFLIAGIRVFGRTENITIDGLHIAQNKPQELSDSLVPSKCEDLIDTKLNFGISVGEGDTVGTDMLNTSHSNIVENITISNVFIEGHIVGIQLVFTYNYEILNSDFIKNSYYSLLCGSSWIVPNTLDYGAYGSIENCRFVDNTSNNGSITKAEFFRLFYVIGLYRQNNVVIKKCMFSNNTSNCDLTIIDVEASKNLVFNDVKIGNSSATKSRLTGVGFTDRRGYLINQCLEKEYLLENNLNVDISDLVIRKFTNSTFLTGLFMTNVKGSNIENSKIFDITSYAAMSSAYEFTESRTGSFSSNINLNNCTAINVGTLGFTVNGLTESITYNSCYVTNSFQGYSIVRGTYTDLIPSFIKYNNCKSFKCYYGIIGVLVNSHMNNLEIINCKILNSINSNIYLLRIFTNSVVKNNLLFGAFLGLYFFFPNSVYISNNVSYYNTFNYFGIPDVFSTSRLNLNGNTVNLNLSITP